MKTVLLVDDNAFMRKIQASILQALGYEVTLADSGAQALWMLRTLVVDFVLMDMQMPEMDGLQTTEKLRQQGFRRPIIALTGNDHPEDRALCAAAGMNGFVAKPLTQQGLLAAIANC